MNINSVQKTKSVIDLIGSTPMVKINQIVDSDMSAIYAKLESCNPGGSVKDRIALSMIESAEKSGFLQKGNTIVEPTSGNTGIGLAMVATVKGYKVILVMSESLSYERRFLLESYGATTKSSGIEKGMQGTIAIAEEIVSKNSGYFMPQQFNNPANPDVHRRTTAVEIYEAMGGETIDAFVAGVGTGGTITGVGEYLKSKNPDVKIIAVEPESSPVLSGGGAGYHKIQGIGAGFIPKILNTEIIDDIILVSDENAYDMAKKLGKREGLVVGISSGAACFAAMKVATKLGRGANVVTLFPDTGSRYMSMDKDFK
jgi:cysteine synthase A